MSEEKTAAEQPPAQGETPPRPRKTLGREARELWDTIVLAYVLVTLMKTFVVDLYKIPSGSMTPTLIGDPIEWRDVNDDDIEDLVIYRLDPRGPDSLGRPFIATQAFLGQEDGSLVCDRDELRNFTWAGIRATANELDFRYDRILVNKLWYWFFPLERGDILVFKLPEEEFAPETPFYIKRVAGLEGETPTIDDQGHLVIDGEPVTEPDVIAQNHYFAQGSDRHTGHNVTLPYVGVEIPGDHFVVWGDNSGNSLDSRYWGPVEVERVRGRAFFRYWPLRHVSFLE